MANFTEIVKQSFRVIPLKQVGHLRVTKAPRPSEGGHLWDEAAEANAAATLTSWLHHSTRNLHLQQKHKQSI